MYLSSKFFSMKKILTTLVLLFSLSFTSKAQLYFPPILGANWDTISPQQLGWCTERIDSLYDLLQRNNTKAFIILKDGKIAVEKYFDTFTKDSLWYWASAGKTVTSFLVGMAQQEGKLSIYDSTSKYLGTGWTTCPPEKERLITVRHQLTMTTGLDYLVPDWDCKLPSCLKYKADAGSQWFYHNAPYLLLQDVLENASGFTYQQFTNTRLSNRTGVFGLWLDGVFYSKPRNMARFGLLMLNKGVWNGDTLLKDTTYYREMINTSQNLNQSYGYLWWLNGKPTHKLPGTNLTFQGDICPPAPDEVYAALGKNDQKLYVWPSQKIVVVRMGNPAADSSLVPVVFDVEMWTEINKLVCNLNTAVSPLPKVEKANVYPNPVNQRLTIDAVGNNWSTFSWEMFSSAGNTVASGHSTQSKTDISTVQLPAGFYTLRLLNSQGESQLRKVSIVH